MIARKLAAALAAAAIASVGLTGVAQGAQVGDTCQVNQSSSGWYILVDWFQGGYYVYYPEWVIIDGVWDGAYYYQAHKSGWASGTLNGNAINESTCYQ